MIKLQVPFLSVIFSILIYNPAYSRYISRNFTADAAFRLRLSSIAA